MAYIPDFRVLSNNSEIGRKFLKVDRPTLEQKNKRIYDWLKYDQTCENMQFNLSQCSCFDRICFYVFYGAIHDDVLLSWLAP